MPTPTNGSRQAFSPQSQQGGRPKVPWGLRRFMGGLLLLVAIAMGGCGMNQGDSQTPPSQLSGGPVSGNVITNAGVTVLDAAPLPAFDSGQVVYVPVYSEIYNQNPQSVSQLTVTLSIRNTDLKQPIIIDTVDYYDTSGRKIKQYLSKPMQLSPLASVAVVVSQLDQTGGVGANFIVTWGATKPVHVPVIEAVMISTASQQGLSFVSVGRVIAPRSGSQ